MLLKLKYYGPYWWREASPSFWFRNSYMQQSMFVLQQCSSNRGVQYRAPNVIVKLNHNNFHDAYSAKGTGQPGHSDTSTGQTDAGLARRNKAMYEADARRKLLQLTACCAKTFHRKINDKLQGRWWNGSFHKAFSTSSSDNWGWKSSFKEVNDRADNVVVRHAERCH